MIDTPQESKMSDGSWGLVCSSAFADIAVLRGKIAGKQTRTVIDIERSFESNWVVKYKPSKFTDLISPPSINVQLLRWCNDWKNLLNKSVSEIERNVRPLIHPL